MLLHDAKAEIENCQFKQVNLRGTGAYAVESSGADAPPSPFATRGGRLKMRTMPPLIL